ncbi:MAG: hypothetical protein KDM91_13155, partial [Verrucomicrobiae bacterium]|nr:hypothetical protein [Verrucomicrobiae bacterium]
LAADAETGDEAVAAPLPLPEGVAMETIDVALETPVNAGITAFRMRPVPLEHGQFEAYVQVALNASAPAPVTGKLDVFVGGVLAYPREISLEPGQRQGLTLSLEGAEEQMLRLRLRVDGDCLAADNEVIEPLPRVRPVVAAWIAPKESADPFTELALSAIQREGELDLWKGSPENWPLPDGIDVVIFDGWLPDAWPENLPVIVMNPPGPLGPIRAKHLENGVPYDEVRVANEQHPILFRVSSGRVALTQTAVFDISGSLEPLWFAGTEPVLAAGEIGGQRIVMMGFSPSQSEHLPLMASFPLLVGNSLLWCAETAPSVIERLVEAPTGRVVPVAGRQVTWSTSRNGALEKFTLPLDAPLLELDRTGLWETDTGQRGAAYLLSRAETDIAAREARDPAGVDLQSPAAGASARLSGDVTWALLGILVTLLIAESWLFHRHAVY